MKFYKRFSLYALLTGSLLLLPVSQTGTAANQETDITVNQNPLQEEMQYLTPSQLAEEENLLAILWVQRSAEFRGLSYQAYNLAAMEIDKAVARRQELKNKQKAKVRSQASLSIANRQEMNSPLDDRNLSATPETMRPLAVVLDIDDTIVCHAPLKVYYMEHPEAKANYKAWQAWIAQHKELLPGAKDFLKHADSRGVQVFYVTGRGAQDRDITLAFLRNAGLPLPDATHLRMNDKSGSKMNHFTALAQKYDIVCYIGDNAADFPIGALRYENKVIYKHDANDKKASTNNFALQKNNTFNESSAPNNNCESDNPQPSAVKTKQLMPLDIHAMLKHDTNKSRNAKIDANRNSFGTKFILLPNPMYGDWEYNLAKKYHSLPSEQRIALRKAVMKSFTPKEK
ncbi:MAG: hypothetical protein IJ056_07370 [Acidaminococcaceae bacterium]|nr:hypothetical protein [Acidaminococcaceae bacterium]